MTKNTISTKTNHLALLLGAFLAVGSACQAQGPDSQNQSTQQAAQAASVVGPSCAGAQASSKDPATEKFCVALHYVTYTKDGKPTMTNDQVAKEVTGMNKVWDQCGINFQAEAVDPVNPADKHLEYQPSGMGAMDDIRKAYADDTRFLVASTGAWTMGGAAVAWT